MSYNSTTYYTGENVSGTIVDNGDALILSGGTAIDTFVYDGTVSVLPREGAASYTVMNGGTLYASGNYVKIESTIIESGAVFSALDGVEVNGTVVNSGGSVVTYAKSFDNTIVNDGGSVAVLGGSANHLSMYTGGDVSIKNQDTVVNYLLLSAQPYSYTSALVRNYATVNFADVTGGGYLCADGNAFVNSANLDDGGTLILSSGASAIFIDVNSGGSMIMEDDAQANAVTVNFGGSFYAGFNWYGFYGDLATIGAEVKENGGSVYVGSGWTSRYVDGSGYVSSCVQYPVFFQSNVFSNLVYSNGIRGTVHSGTSAENITAINGGLTVYEGGIVRGYTVTPTTYESAYEREEESSFFNEKTNEWVYDTVVVSGFETVTELGALTVVAGGTVTGLVAQSLPDYDEDTSAYLNFEFDRDTLISGRVDGNVFSARGGVIMNAALKDASLTYLEGTSAIDITQINGNATFESGVNAYGLVFSGTTVVFSSGAYANGVMTAEVPYTYIDYGMGFDQQQDPKGTLVNTSRGATIHIYAGANVTDIEMDSLSHLHLQVAPDTLLRGTSGGYDVSMRGGVFANACLGNTYVEVLGPTASTDATAGAAYTVGGGTVSNLVVNPGACVSAWEGAVALDLVENGGAVLLGWGETIPESISYSFTSNTFSHEHLEGGEYGVTVHKNTIAVDNIMFGGRLSVFSGGVVENFYVAGADNGRNKMPTEINLYSGATVTNIDTVRYADQDRHSGWFYIFGGVQIDGARLTDYDGITLVVSSDTQISNASLDNIPFSVVGGVLSGFKTSLDEAPYSDSVTIQNGAQIIDCFVDANGSVELQSGAYGRGNTFARNYVYVYNDTVLENTTLGLDPKTIVVRGETYDIDRNATMYLYEGGVVRNITVNSGSGIEAYGGKLTGKVRIADGWVSKSNETLVVDFDLTAPDAFSEARYDDLTVIQGAPRFTITVDGGNQPAGSYVLAEKTSFIEGEYLWIDVMDVNGSTIGYFSGYKDSHPVDTEVPGEVEFTSVFDVQFYPINGNDQSDFTYTLDLVPTYASDGTVNESLVLTVDSPNAAPVWLAAPTVTANIETFTNSDVVLTLGIGDKSVTKEYSVDGQIWYSFGNNDDGRIHGEDLEGATSATDTGNNPAGSDSWPTSAIPELNESIATLTVTENGTYYFRGSNPFGEVSDVTSFTVSNIDKLAPSAPMDLDSWTTENDDGSVTLTFGWSESADNYSGIRKYIVNYWEKGSDVVTTVETPYKHFDVVFPVSDLTDDVGKDGNWEAASPTVTVNTSDWNWNVQAVDYAGNVSEVAEYDEGVLPGPVLTPDIALPTSGLVSVSVSSDPQLGIVDYEYSTDDQLSWQLVPSDGVITIAGNGVIWVRGRTIDKVLTESTSIVIDNIDQEAPEAPIAAASTEELTNQNVTVTATFSNDSVTREYSYDGRENWTPYPENGIEFEENGYVYFRGIDAAGNVSNLTLYEVTNIDKEPPAAPVVSAETSETFVGVLVTATFSQDSVSQEYSFEGKRWIPYEGGVTVSEIGTVVFFRAFDAAGNMSEITEYKVEGSTGGPAAPVAIGSTTDPTNGDVYVFATFDGDALSNEYSLDGRNWSVYEPGTNGIPFTENGTVYFRSADAAGNYSPITTYTVDNIDKVAPTAPVAGVEASPVADVLLVSAVFSDDSVAKEYSLDGQTWQAYEGAVTVTEAGTTVYFRGTDAAGNVSEITEYKVEGSTEGPAAPVAGASNTDPTKEDVLVYARFSDDSVKKEYSLDGETWSELETEGVILRENGTVYFRSADAAGNYSPVTIYTVENIDKVPPAAPAPYADITEPTNQPVTVFAQFSEDSVVRSYSIASTGIWSPYDESGIVLRGNDTVYFAAEDAAGNYSEMTFFVVSNIDTTPPIAPVASVTTSDGFDGVLVSAVFSDDSAMQEYSFDGRTWQTYQNAVPVTEIGTTVYFRGTDAVGNVSDVTEYKVESFVTGPAAPVAVASTTEPTNNSVFVTATFDETAAVNQYSLNTLDWFTYESRIVFRENGVVYFRSLDADGRVSAITTVSVDNIDLEAPNAPYAYASFTGPTNQDVTVYAMFSDDSVVRRYAVSSPSNWTDYTDDGVVVDRNTTVYFAAMDAAGNGSQMTTFEVTNIDKVAPDAPTVTVTNANLPEGKGCNIAATFSADSVTKEYSPDGETWQEYQDAILVTTADIGKKYYFRGTDAAGNVSDVRLFTVESRSFAPAAPVAYADITEPTNGSVTVYATFDETATVRKYTIGDLSNWTDYTDAGVVVSYNTTVYFACTDADDNGSDMTSFVVSNIDKTPPEKPVVSASTTEATFDPVVVTATFSADSVVRQYSCDGRENWMDYPEDGVTLEKNGYVFFRGIDAAGNESITVYDVANIVQEETGADVDDGWNDAVFLKNAYLPAADAVVTTTLSGLYEWTMYYDFTGGMIQLDKYGTVYKEEGLWNAAGGTRIVGKKKETDVDFARVTVETPGMVSFSIKSDAAVKFTLYTITADAKGKLSVKKAQSKFDAGTSCTDQYLLTNADENTRYYISVESAKKGVTAYYTVDLNYNGCVFYGKGNNEDDWTDMKQLGSKGHVGNAGKLEDRFDEFEGFDNEALVTDWVGSGDDVDYFKITLEHGAKLRFVVTSGWFLNFSLSTLEGSAGKYKLNSVIKESPLKYGDKVDENEYAYVDGYKYALTTKDVLLEAGTYYLAVKAPNAGKNVDADYIVDIGGKIFLNANNKDDGEKFKKNPGSLLDVGSLGLISDNSIGTRIDEDWVGFGDAVDYKYFILSNSAKLNFTISATDSVKLTVYEIRNNKGKYSLSAFSKNVATITNKNGDADFFGTASTGSIFLSGADGSKYCICVESTNAKKGGDADYSIEIDSDGSSFLPVWKDPFDVDNTGLMIKTKGIHGGTVEIIDIDQWAKDSTFANGLKGYTGWVGYGDAVDTLGFTIPADTPINQICIRSTDEVTFTLAQVIRSGKGTYKTKTIIKSTKVKACDPMNTAGYSYEFNSVALNGSSKNAKDLGAGDYIIIVKSTNAAKGGNADYTLILRSEALETKNSDALSMPEDSAAQLGFAETCAGSAAGLAMPETGSLAMTDSLSFGQYDTDALADVSSASGLAELDDKSAWQNLLA